jgi:hypothetical protein
MKRTPLSPRTPRQHAIALPAQNAMRETPEVYRAVVALRRRRFRVWRSGGDHLVGGRLLSTLELFQMERQVSA